MVSLHPEQLGGPRLDLFALRPYFRRIDLLDLAAGCAKNALAPAIGGSRW
jgi:hypothetical protein